MEACKIHAPSGGVALTHRVWRGLVLVAAHDARVGAGGEGEGRDQRHGADGPGGNGPGRRVGQQKDGREERHAQDERVGDAQEARPEGAHHAHQLRRLARPPPLKGKGKKREKE